MFHRVVMDIGDVVGQIPFVADRVLPESGLPWRVDCRQPPRESFLEILDQSGIVVATVSHPDHGVDVIGHDDERDDPVRHTTTCAAPCCEQRIDTLDQKLGASVTQRDGKGIRTVASAISAIVDHAPASPWVTPQSIGIPRMRTSDFPDVRHNPGKRKARTRDREGACRCEVPGCGLQPYPGYVHCRPMNRATTSPVRSRCGACGLSRGRVGRWRSRPVRARRRRSGGRGSFAT